MDASGYDLILECNGTLRHVQIKSRKLDGATANWGLHLDLAAKASGCFVLMLHSVHKARFKLEYRYFGGRPGDPLVSLESRAKMVHSVKRTKRENHRKINWGDLREPLDAPGLMVSLFGPRTAP